MINFIHDITCSTQDSLLYGYVTDSFREKCLKEKMYLFLWCIWQKYFQLYKVFSYKYNFLNTTLIEFFIPCSILM